MLLETMMAFALAWPGASHDGASALSGRDFETLLQQVERRSPETEARLRKARPSRLLDVEDAFRAQLSGPARARLDERLGRTADGAISACDRRSGPSCAAGAYLTALREAKLTDAFVLYLVGHAGRLR